MGDDRQLKEVGVLGRGWAVGREDLLKIYLPSVVAKWTSSWHRDDGLVLRLDRQTDGPESHQERELEKNPAYQVMITRLGRERGLMIKQDRHVRGSGERID